MLVSSWWKTSRASGPVVKTLWVTPAVVTPSVLRYSETFTLTEPLSSFADDHLRHPLETPCGCCPDSS